MNRADATSTDDGIFTYSRDLLGVCDAEGRLVRVSEACVRLVGYQRAELLGSELVALVHPLDVGRAQRAFQQVLSTGHVEEVATRIRRKEGGWVPVRWSGSAPEDRTHVFMVGREMRRERQRANRTRALAVLREATAERDRLRSDLHDGLLQSLTGISLKLATALRQLESDAAAARAELEGVAEVLQHEHRELRFLIQEMKEGWHEGQTGRVVNLDERLADFARRLHAVWNIELRSEVTGNGELPLQLRPAVLRIVQEAVVNAAKHAHARSATVRIHQEPRRVVLHIADDGRGFTFTGRFDDAALRAQKRGPAVLKHRVWALGGTLTLDSSETGTSLEVAIPFGREP